MSTPGTELEVAPLPPRRSTCACGTLELAEDEIAPDAVDDLFSHSQIVCYFLDEELEA